ncbi:MAG: aminodeoxychorismate/anthranilate synthase component II [Cytophagales bacterium]|nr:aminodeoxychorismate/anthranilate synthase component II [Bernardetiaceae bacterium]MDW8210571.1 aminodeoxychorismate/anthranilate synthase component II [Cytophagales bacterium]
MPARLLLLDNYDSFTYNLAQLIEENFMGQFDVRTYDAISLAQVGDYDKIIFSPGPGVPSEIPLMQQILLTYGASKSILGVCLGHQAIAESFGARLYNLPKVQHGLRIPLQVTEPQELLFKGLPRQFYVGLYHSWAVTDLPACLKTTAISANGVVMAIAHQSYDIRGVQFHPESFMTQYGAEMLQNWLSS